MATPVKVVAIIQARMGSTRLPGKVLADIGGKPMLQILLERLRATPEIERIVVATTDDSEDDVLVDWLHSHGVFYTRGSVHDVLDRFWQCAQQYPAEFIVRITADDPLKDPEIIAQALALCESSPGIDYASNTLHPSFPEGLDVEVLRYRALKRAASEASLPSEREHVTPYVWNHSDRFVIRSFGMSPDLSSWRWTVDKPADLELMRAIFRHFDGNFLVGYREVIAWMQENPELLKMNAGTIRNEGYYKTLSMEQK